jgi:hypothetical protein
MAANEEVNSGPSSNERRHLLRRAAALGGAIWAAPAITRIGPAAAQASASTISGNSAVWKWNAASPSADTVCSSGTAGNANRGTASFSVVCTNPPSVSVTITINNGPALTGANARQISILQSNDGGNCLAQVGVGTYNSPNGVAVTFGPTPVVAGTTHFSMIMVQSGGGGTDTYTTTRVRLVC